MACFNDPADVARHDLARRIEPLTTLPQVFEPAGG